MKRLHLRVGRFLLVLLVLSCNVPSQISLPYLPASQKAQVRFQNATSNLYVYFGIGLGNAQCTGGLNPGSLSSYYDSLEGTYHVQIKQAVGSWVNDSAGTFTISNGHLYTVTLQGDASAHSYSMVQDQ
ncbi:MAG TPA: hypothetical protein VMF68_01370 [Spirochaetia bacterium]|nr:hypothetical protein [Spirochaetia bacterium]